MKFFKKRQNKSGFTLVELVVVIAVLAILAGVGAVAYNGYIEYAKKGVDRKTIGEIMNALELADYSDPTLFGSNPNGIVILSSKGAVGSTPAVQTAITDAGINATLSYEKWPGALNAKDAATKVKNALDSLSFLNDGSGNLTYAAVASQSWDAVKNAVDQITALLNSGEFGTAGGDVENLGPALVLAAAKAAQNSSDNLDWTAFNPSTDSKTESLPALVARNYSFAEYLRQNCNYEGLEDDIEELQNVVKTANDFITGGYQDPLKDTSKNQQYKDAAEKYLTSKNGDGVDALTQAQMDNQGYNQMMKSMYEQYKDQLETYTEGGKTYYKFKGDTSTFWDEAGGFLSTAGQMAQMTADERAAFLESFPDEGTAIQVVIKSRNADGSLNLASIPADASPRTENGSEGGCNHEHTTGKVKIDYIQRTSIVCETSNIVLCNTAGATSVTFVINNKSSKVEQDFSMFTADDTLTWAFEGNDDNVVSLSKDGTLTASPVSETRTVTLTLTMKKAGTCTISITIYP